VTPSGGSAVCITAAGSSSRMKSGKKKEYQSIDGVPVLITSIKPFLETGLFQSIVIIVPTGHCEQVSSLILPILSKTSVSIDVIEGGLTRQESVFKGLCALEHVKPGIVLIHDAARPWVTSRLITSVYAATKEYGACIPVIEIPDAPKELGGDSMIARHFPKHRLVGAQTPQGFLFDRILEAHRRAASGHAVCADDSEVLSLANGLVFTIPGEPSNRKITYPHDLEEV
jgi:2-C-methyl-D-erythritol 4-phosphate cytidylyltransferase